MRRFTRIRLVVWLLTLVGLLAACAGQPEVADTTQAPSQTTAATDGSEPGGGASDDPIRIGGTLGLTGAFAGPSDHYRTYYEEAVERLNDRGGLLGRPVELILYDDESTQATARSLYERLDQEDDVDIFLAPYTTFIGGAVIPIVRESGKVFVNAGFVGWDIARQYDRIFFMWTIQEPTYPQPFFDMLAGLPEEDRPQRMALLTAQNPFTVMERDGADGFGGVLNFAEELGIEVVVNEEYPSDISDPSPLIQRAIDANADLFVVLGLPQDSVLMARTAGALGYEPAAYCTCGSTMNAFPVWRELGEAGNHVFANNPVWQTDDLPGMGVVVEIAEGIGLENIPPYAPMSYATFQVIEEAVQGAGTTEGEALAEYMYQNTFSTAAGELTFDEFGVPEYYGTALQYVDGEVHKVWPREGATAEPIVPRP